MSVVWCAWFAAGCACATDAPPPPVAVERPNILLVVADDLGYSDLAPYGSEIPTPTLDRLATAGLIATDFYVSPRGAPTRAMLLTGLDHHQALARGGSPADSAPDPPSGDLTLEEDRASRLSERVVTLAASLRAAGYHTYMAGKWELGTRPGDLPADRGFERSFALLEETASYWSDMKSATVGRTRARYSQDGTVLDSLPPEYFSTRFFTDFAIESIDTHRGDGRPFFAYLAYQAPHAPLSVPEDWRERAAGRYAGGFQAIQQRRLTGQKRRRLVRRDVVPFPGLPTVPLWTDLDDGAQKTQARKMELYAASVENLDYHLGRLLEHLGETGEREKTLVVFLSDNGASPRDRGPGGITSLDREWLTTNFPKDDLEDWGGPGSFVEYGAGWAQTSSVPFRFFKGTLGEGGIRSPLVVSGPGVLRQNETTRALLHVTDIAPTLLDFAGVRDPGFLPGGDVAIPAGRSWVPLLGGGTDSVRDRKDWIGFELDGNRALRQGQWKIVQMARPLGTGKWRLYRLDRDPAELYDRAEAHPDRLAALVRLWGEYARTHAIPLPSDATASR